MGEAPLEGVWFGEMNKGFRGAFWWRALLRCAAGWPDAAVGAAETPNPHDQNTREASDE
jgi:hypothetical protein